MNNVLKESVANNSSLNYSTSKKSLKSEDIYYSPVNKEAIKIHENIELPESSDGSIQVFSNGDENSAHILYSK